MVSSAGVLNENACLPKRAFVTGITGVIGLNLVGRLAEAGWQVTAMSRDVDAARATIGQQASALITSWIEGDCSKPGLWQAEITGHQAVLALAGERIFERRWNAEFKQRIFDSRVGGIKCIVDAIQNCASDLRPEVLITGSAYGWYGASTDAQTEATALGGHDFMSHFVSAWEQAAEEADIRVVQLRLGLVLAKRYGFLEDFTPRFRKGLGGVVGSGHQYIPMIHVEDVINLILLALERQDISGPLNLTMPEPATMEEFSVALAKQVGRPAFLHMPSFVMKLILGEVAGSILESRRILPSRAQELGYRFRFPNIVAALEDCVPSRRIA